MILAGTETSRPQDKSLQSDRSLVIQGPRGSSRIGRHCWRGRLASRPADDGGYGQNEGETMILMVGLM